MYIKTFLQVLLLLIVALSFVTSCKPKDEPPVITSDSTKVINDTTIYDSVCFERNILPIFKSNCAIEACHDAITGQEGIVFDSYNTFFLKGFVSGDASKSQVFNAIIRTTFRRMPPIPTYALDSNQINTIEKWINQGMPEKSCYQEIDTNKFSYLENIYPIIKNNCFGCHNDKAVYPNNINFQTYEQIKNYAINGKLLGAIKHQKGFRAMPDTNTYIDPAYIRIIEKWIESGTLNN